MTFINRENLGDYQKWFIGPNSYYVAPWEYKLDGDMMNGIYKHKIWEIFNNDSYQKELVDGIAISEI